MVAENDAVEHRMAWNGSQMNRMASMKEKISKQRYLMEPSEDTLTEDGDDSTVSLAEVNVLSTHTPLIR